MKEAKQVNIEMLAGRIDKFSFNKHDDIDGMTIIVEGKKKEIKFPPHTAKYIMALAENGDEVEINYEAKERHGDKPHPPHFHLVKIKNVKTDKSFEVKSVHPPKLPVEKEIIELDVQDYKLKKNTKDEVVGIVFKNNFIHVDPKLSEKIVDKLENGVLLSVKVQKRTHDTGFANVNQYHVYHSKALEVSKNLH